MQEEGGPPAVRRRAVLGGIAGLGFGFDSGLKNPVESGLASASETHYLSVATWNLYQGVRLQDLTDVESKEELREGVGNLLIEAERHPYNARLDAITSQIANERPAVFSVQEAVRARKRPVVGDNSDRDGSDTSEWTTVVDLLNQMETELAEKGLDYSVASSTLTTDEELVAETADGAFALSVADRVATFVRDDIATGETRTGTYDTGVTYSLPGVDREVELQRGYCLVDVTVGGRPVTVVNTHLEWASDIIRRLQAEELLDLVPDDGPVVVAGDFNSGPGGAAQAYVRLVKRFDDAWVSLRDDNGYTCCQHPSLMNDESGLSRRIDAVLFDGPLNPIEAVRVGGQRRPDQGRTLGRDGHDVAVQPRWRNRAVRGRMGAAHPHVHVNADTESQP